MAAWDPSQYLKFAGPRARPALDLLNRVELDSPDAVFDLGCGAGNVTRMLARRWPQAAVTGVDGSAEMLARARAGDGAITWVCPGTYNRDVAIPAIRDGAKKAGRTAPPLIAHAPVSVHEDAGEVRSAMREQMGNYPSNPNYARMFADAGFPEAVETGEWSDEMIDAVVLHGDEEKVKERLREMFDQGTREIMVSPVLAGRDREASYERTMRLVAEAARGVGG